MSEVDAPVAMEFSVGTTEQKMDMSLDDIIKQSKKANARSRVPNKGRNKQPNAPAAKAALQKSVASRSSGMRQGKFAEARARNSGKNFPATEAASRRAFAAPINTRSRQIMKNRSEAAGRPAFERKRNFQRGSNSFPVAAPNMAPNLTVSIVNDASKVGAGRPSGNSRRRNPAAAPAAFRQVSTSPVPTPANQFQTQSQRPKTLDSLFVSIRNTPQPTASKFNVQQGGRRRGGGGGGGGGRGRGQQGGPRMPYV